MAAQLWYLDLIVTELRSRGGDIDHQVNVSLAYSFQDGVRTLAQIAQAHISRSRAGGTASSGESLQTRGITAYQEKIIPECQLFADARSDSRTRAQEQGFASITPIRL